MTKDSFLGQLREGLAAGTGCQGVDPDADVGLVGGQTDPVFEFIVGCWRGNISVDHYKAGDTCGT